VVFGLLRRFAARPAVPGGVMTFCE